MHAILQFVRHSWALLLFGFISVFFGNFGQSFFIGVYGESIKDSLNLSASAYGSIYSIATFFAGFIFLFAGGWIDKLPLRRFSLFAALGMFAACIFLGVANSVYLLFIGFFLVRLFGQGLLPHTGLITMARMFNKNRGKALSIATSAVPIGEILLPFVAVVFILNLGWQSSWFVFAIFIPLVYIPFAWFLLNDKNSRPPEIQEHDETKKHVLKDINGRYSLLATKQFWLVLPALLYGPFVVTGVFIHQDYVIFQKDWGHAWWASCFVFYGIVHWLSSLAVGVLIDRFSAKKLIAWYNVPIVLSMLCLVLASGDLVTLAFLGFLGITIGFGGPIGSAMWAELYGTSHLGGIRSMVAAFSVVATAISPVLLGAAIDSNLSFSTIVYVTMAVGIVAALMSTFAYRKCS